VRGPIDPQTGMVIDLAELKRVVGETVVERFDHADLNADRSSAAASHDGESRDHGVGPPGAEARRRPALAVRVWEDPSLFVDYRGPMLELTRVYHFSAGHRLADPALSDEANEALYGACYRPHGHNYYLEVTVAGRPDPVTGMSVDLGRIDGAVHEARARPRRSPYAGGSPGAGRRRDDG